MSSTVRAIATAIITILLTSQSPIFAVSAIPAPTPMDKCAVCGMFVAKYQNWIASIRLKTGTIAHFDGPKDMFRYLQNPGKYHPTVKQADVADITVRDYYSLKPVDARTAYFVAGSNVNGPMGKELVPFAIKSDAQGFLKDHQGKKIYRFNEITPAIMTALD